LNFFRHRPQFRVVYGLHGGDGIDRRHLDGAVAGFLHQHIARQHEADFVFGLERPVGKLGVAGAEDGIGAKSTSSLFFNVALMSMVVSTPKPFSLNAPVTFSTASSKGSDRVLLKW